MENHTERIRQTGAINQKTFLVQATRKTYQTACTRKQRILEIYWQTRCWSENNRQMILLMKMEM